MDELADEFRVAAESIEKSRESVALIAQASSTISARSESIVACTEKLDPILHTLNNQLEAFSELRQKAHEAFPEIEGRLNDLTTEFSSVVQSAINDSHESMESQRAEFGRQTNLLKKTVEDIAKELSNIVDRNEEEIKKLVNTLHNALQKEVNTLNASLKKAWEDSLQKLADRFASLSDGFVNNYKELAASHKQLTTEHNQLIREAPATYK